MEDRSVVDRSRMIDTQIAARGITNKSVLRAMRGVPRHEFVPADKKAYSYEDYPLPIGFAQTISQPYIVAFMTELLEPEPWHRVLEIGTGSGYQAAVLAEIVDQVYTVEIIEALAKRSAALLERLRYKNVHTLHADGYAGWIDQAPFDSIIVTAAAGSIPPQLITQLKTGGRLCIPVGMPAEVQTLCLVRKFAEDQIAVDELDQVRFVPLTRGDGGKPAR